MTLTIYRRNNGINKDNTYHTYTHLNPFRSHTMAKKDKKKSAEAKAARTAKQSKKQEKSEKRRKAKGKDDDSDAEDVDLDAVLAQYAEEQAKFLKVTETVIAEPPSPRSSCTIIASPAAGKNELFIFGGETFDGTLARFYNNLFIYNVDKHEWREITSPNSPLPRSGHAWCRGGNQGGIYMFGGEFSSPKQGTFYHYNDFWHLDPVTREWTRVETKGKGPPARSGHRMTYYKVFKFPIRSMNICILN